MFDFFYCFDAYWLINTYIIEMILLNCLIYLIKNKIKTNN